MADKLIKVKLPKIDCRNIYFVNNDELFGGKEITSAPTYIPRDYKLVLRVTYVNRSAQREQTKKTFSFNKKTTFLQSLKQVSAYREKLLADLKEGKHKKEQIKIPTLAQAWEAYIEMKQSKLSPNTLVSYNKFVQKWILAKPSLAKTPIDKLTTRQLQSVVNHILQSGKSPRTAKSVKELLRPMLKRHVFEGTLNTNPADLIQIPKFNNEVTIDLPEEKIKALYNALYHYPVEPFRSIFVWLSHGRRLNEILSLEWQDINLDNQTYTIRFENNKVRKPMTYKLTKSQIDTLDLTNTPKNGYVFPAITRKDKKMDKGTVRNHWEKILKEVDIKIRIHDLRHLIGGTLVSEGKTLEQVASVLGHTSTSVTKRYSKVRQEVAAESLDDFFKRVR